MENENVFDFEVRVIEAGISRSRRCTLLRQSVLRFPWNLKLLLSRENKTEVSAAGGRTGVNISL